MRVGLSWDMDRFASAGESYATIVDESVQADQMGFHSVWVHEAREADSHCPEPSILLTYLAKKTSCIQLRIAGRRATPALLPHIPEEVAVLDTFSKGRAGIAFASASSQGLPPGHVNELVDFVASAIVHDEFRYRGDHIRFPAHTPDDAPPGASTPAEDEPYLPQWDWGPVTPDFLSITPKPYGPGTPIHVEIEDSETLDWAARGGISPLVGANVPTARAVELLCRYREVAGKAGRLRREVEPVLERRIALDGASDQARLGGSTREILDAIRGLRGRTGIAHLVWRRDAALPMDLHRFASEIQVLLQA